jgi:hypothetical protein
MGLGRRMLAIKDSPFRAVVYLPAAVLLGVVLVLSLLQLGALFFAFFLFAIPYWFGDRRPRRLALFGGIGFLALVAILSLIIASLNLSSPPTLQESPNGVLKDGRVMPESGAADVTDFTFRIVYNATDFPLAGPTTNLTTRSFSGISVRQLNMTAASATPDGVEYVATTTLPEGLHAFHFAVQTSDGRWIVTRASQGLGFESEGPDTVSPVGYYFLHVAYILSPLLVFTLVPFLFIVALYWWNRQVKERRRAFLKGSAKGDCPKCGAAITDGNATECPLCGAPLSPKEGRKGS